MHLSMLCRRGGERRAWGGYLIVFVGPGVGHLTDPVLPGEGIFESFFARRGDIWPPTRTKKAETVQQILSGLVVSVVYWYFWSWVRMLLPSMLLQLEAENSSTLYKFHKGERGYGRWGLKLTVSLFHASRMRRMLWKDLEIMEANENKRKLSGFHCFVFKFNLF